MKLGILFSGGKDSVYATYLAKNQGNKIQCLISVFSKNKESYMFHTPNIEKTKLQAKLMKIPLIIQKTKGEKEEELKDLRVAIKNAKAEFGIEGIVTGAIRSVYQSSRIQKICDEFGLTCFNPLWNKNEEEYLNELLRENFKIMVVGVFAHPLDNSWLGRIIDKGFIEEAKALNKKYKIHIAGEGGEFESFVLNCPLFSREIKVKSFKDFGKGNSWRREIDVE